MFPQHRTYFARGDGGSETGLQHACFSPVGQLRRPDHVVDFFEQTAACLCHAYTGWGEAHASTGPLE